MRIFGLDFSAASHEGVPIACTSCVLESRVLYVHCLALLENLDSFENFLSSEGPWVAGIDFPFGQPRKLVKNLGWPMRWEGYVGRSEGLGLTRFELVLEEYRETRPLGDKQYLRSVDSQANFRTPMSLRQVPTSRLFQRCAPRLLRSPVSVLPCRPNRDERVVLEAYPALVARRLIDRRPYKGTSPDELSDLRLDARRDLLDGLMSQRLEDEFGVALAVDSSIRDELIEEPSGNYLDAILCSLQATWAWNHREHGWGIPSSADSLEGWIVDPALAHPQPAAPALTG